MLSFKCFASPLFFYFFFFSPDDSFGNDDGSYTVFVSESEVVPNVTFGNYKRPHVTVDSIEAIPKALSISLASPRDHSEIVKLGSQVASAKEHNSDKQAFARSLIELLGKGDSS